MYLWWLRGSGFKEFSDWYIEYLADLIEMLDIEVFTITTEFGSRNEADRFIAHFIGQRELAHLFQGTVMLDVFTDKFIDVLYFYIRERGL